MTTSMTKSTEQSINSVDRDTPLIYRLEATSESSRASSFLKESSRRNTPTTSRLRSEVPVNHSKRVNVKKSLPLPLRPSPPIHRSAPQDRSEDKKASFTTNHGTRNMATPVGQTNYKGSPIVSPPFLIPTPSIETKNVDLSMTGYSIPENETSMSEKCSLAGTIDEIEHLARRFSLLDERNGPNHFDEELEVLKQKTNAMADTLHKNCLRTEVLQKENNELRARLKIKPILDRQKALRMTGVVEQSKAMQTPIRRNTLAQLDVTDDYVRRQYPSVHKSPGTMFATELVEEMNLEVGEHAYLAEIMDRNWDS